MSLPDNLIEKNHPAETLAQLFWRAHAQARKTVRAALEAANNDAMTKVAGVTAADTIYGIDTIAESALFSFLEARQYEAPAFILVGEFETGEAIRFGKGQPQFRALLDPIDGTRLLMHKKSSGWILTGIAPERGDDTRLSDIFFALQTELPPPKQFFSDTLWASQFTEARGLRENLPTGAQTPLTFYADPATDLMHGFISFVNLFPRGKQLLATLEEEFLYSPAIVADTPREELRKHAEIPIFADQHLSTGGQLYALMTGQLRMVADFRPLLNRRWRRQDETTVLCAHPYDLAAWLIAQRAGVALYAADGAILDGPTDPTAEIGWIGFANHQLAARYLPTLLQILKRHHLLA